jgi:hypothetical protein
MIQQESGVWAAQRAAALHDQALVIIVLLRLCGGRGVVGVGLKLKVGWFGKNNRIEIIEFFIEIVVAFFWFRISLFSH